GYVARASFPSFLPAGGHGPFFLPKNVKNARIRSHLHIRTCRCPPCISTAQRISSLPLVSNSARKGSHSTQLSIPFRLRPITYVRLGVDDTERSQVKSVRGPQGRFGPIIALRRETILLCHELSWCK